MRRTFLIAFPERSGPKPSARCCGRLTRPLLAVECVASLVLVVLAGCQGVDRPVALPVSNKVSAEQLLVLSDFKLAKDHPLIRELSTLREQEASLLELPLLRDPVVVYLFGKEEDYRRYMSETFGLKPRSAYFMEKSSERAVYAHWGAKVREDLRHEYTHGLLHSAMKKVPLWLDEGLAEYFEVSGPRPGGLNEQYARRLSESLANGWRPNLVRLEGLDEKDQNTLMKGADYQESWAWVHFMLHSTPEAKSALIGYLKDLRTTPDAKPLSRRLRSAAPDFEERFVSYVTQLRAAPQTIGAL
jgi:hypothetical protein